MNKNSHLIITILDRPRKNFAVTELLNLAILYKCKKLSYKGVIGWEGSKGKIIPWFIWKKNKKNNNFNSKIFLKKYYSDIYLRLKHLKL